MKLDTNCSEPGPTNSTPAAPMRSVLHATSILTASWFISALVGIVSSKALAVILGPAGFGYYGILQAFIELVSLTASLGIGNALVRSGSQCLAHNDQTGILDLRMGASAILTVTGAFAAATLIVFRAPISRWTTGTSEHATTIVLLVIAVLFTQASYIQINTLNTYHRVTTLAKYGVWSKVATAATALSFVLIWRDIGIVPAVIAGAVASWLVSRHYMARDLGPLIIDRNVRRIKWSAYHLLSIGAPVLCSTLFSRGVLLALPILVLHYLGPACVGTYRAAMTIAVTYLGFLATAMAQDYFPRVSASAHSPETLVQLVNEQQRLLLLLSLPIVLCAIAFGPAALHVLYSSQFEGGVDLLEWLLTADILRLPSWTMSTVVLARCGSTLFFITEFTYGVTLLITSFIGARWYGLDGLGISFAGTYVVYYMLLWAITKRAIHLRWTSSNIFLLTSGVISTTMIRLLPYTPFHHYRTEFGIAITVVVTTISLVSLRGEIHQILSAASLCRHRRFTA